MSTSTELPAWVNANCAAKISQMTAWQVRRLAGRGLISVLQVPGQRPKYRRSDLETLVERSIRPAASPTQA